MPTSPGLLRVGISLPFSRKLIPPGFPALTMISWLARTDVWAGAISVSFAAGWPSAEITTQDVWSARISSVKLRGELAAVALT